MSNAAQPRRIEERVNLQRQFDTLRRDLDHTGSMRAMDDFQAQALNLFDDRQARDAGSMLFAAGGIRTGQVIGAIDRRGEDPISRRVGPGDFLATIYNHLGIDYIHTALPDFSGRPVLILNGGRPIVELT